MRRNIQLRTRKGMTSVLAMLYLVLFSHPTPPERISLARRWVDGSREGASAEA